MSSVHVPEQVAPMIPRTLFNSDHEAFRKTARRFFEQEIAPYHEKWEEQQHLDRDLWNKAGALGLLCPTMPEEYGGYGVDRLYSMILIEEQAYAMLKRYEALSTYPIRTYYPDLTEEHKEKLRIANGGENNPFYGKKHTENTKKTLTEFRKRQRWVFKGEEERQIDAENPIPDGWAYGRSPLLREKMKALGNSNRKGKKKQVKNKPNVPK